MSPITLNQASFLFKTSCNLNHCRSRVELFSPALPAAGALTATRHNRNTPQHAWTLFGQIRLWRVGYWPSDKSGDATLFPLALALGLVPGASPVLTQRKTCDHLKYLKADARAFGYLHQLAFSRALLALQTGEVLPVYRIAVEQREPFRCGVWRIDADVLTIAEQDNEAALQRLVRCGNSTTGRPATRSCACSTTFDPEEPSVSLLTQVQSGKRFAPRRLLLYDTYGIGKSTFGAQAPSPIFVQTEDGLGEIDGAKFPLALSYSDVLKALQALYTESHRYRTVGGDSLDWLERLIWAKICRQRPAGSVPRILTRNLQPNLASLYFHRIIRA